MDTDELEQRLNRRFGDLFSRLAAMKLDERLNVREVCDMMESVTLFSSEVLTCIDRMRYWESRVQQVQEALQDHGPVEGLDW